MNRLDFFSFSFLFLLITFSVKSQEKGNYFLKHFDPKVSGINGQTWTGIEDNNGILYFASGTKIAIYDGKDWDAIQIKNEAQPLSFCKDEKGTIYVGGLGEIGYLKGNYQGKMEYVSLNEKIKKQFRDFQSVWTCVAQDKYVYFSTDKGIYSFNGKSVEFLNEPRTCFLMNLFYRDRKSLFNEVFNCHSSKFTIVMEGMAIKILIEL